MPRSGALHCLTFCFLFIGCSPAIEGSISPAFIDSVRDDERRIFVTALTYFSVADFEGVSGADALCRASAASAGLQREYQALLSTSSLAMKSRLNSGASVYKVSASQERVRVAERDTDLLEATTNNLLAPPNFTAQGDVIVGVCAVWTGSTSVGEHHGLSCTNWSNGDSFNLARVGSCTSTSAVLNQSSSSCDLANRLYCISM